MQPVIRTLAAVLLTGVLSMPAMPIQAQTSAPAAMPLAFADLEGWSGERHDEALEVLLRSCARAGIGREMARLCPAAKQAAQGGRAAARAFFEANFRPLRITSKDGRAGFLTAYYEPEVDGSLRPGAQFAAPLYALPPGRKAGSTAPYLTRGEIEAGALAGKGLELVYVRDRIEAFFIHIQGSARIRLEDGRVLRVGFAGKNGQPYTSIGKVLVDAGLIDRKEMSAQRLRQWLHANPGRADEVMAQNRSFIFFRRLAVEDPALGPVGAQGVPLTSGRSLAVDRNFYDFGVPVWLDSVLPEVDGRPEVFRRLMIAQDTGSAILGAARGDLFLGSGAAAGNRAGLIQHMADFVVLWPNEAALPSWAGPLPAAMTR